MPQLDKTTYIGQVCSVILLVICIAVLVWLGRLLFSYFLDNTEGYILAAFRYFFIRRVVTLTTHYIGGALLSSSWQISCKVALNRRRTLNYIWYIG